MRIYKSTLLQALLFPLFVVVFMVAYFILFGREVVERILSGSAEGWFTVVCLTLVAYGLQNCFGMPFEITLRDDNLLEFRNVFGQQFVPPTDIKSIKRSGAFLVIRHSGGKILLYQGPTGFYDLVTALKKLNPHIAVKGY